MQKHIITWDWNPLVSVGPIKFGESVKSIIYKYNLIKLEPEFESETFATYQFPNYQTCLYVDKNYYIESVGCYDNFFYKGTNLLGVTFGEVCQIIGNKYIIDDPIEYDDFIEHPIEYDDLNLQLWMKNEVINSAICHRFIEN